MNRPGHENAEFFVGTEVERSPMYGQKTLFVVGLQNAEDILTNALNNRCPHIYLGANQSFEPTEDWEKLVLHLLKAGVELTLDFDVQHWEWVIECCFTEYNNFYPMVSVRLPYIGLASYNATVKIDDSDFEHSNPGVWCHSLHELKSRSAFTPWKAYKTDEVIDGTTEDN